MLGGPILDVLRDFRLVEEEAASLGLQLNRGKTEVVTVTMSEVCDTMLCEAPGLHIVDCSTTTLLGSPVGSAEGVDNMLMSKVEVLKLMGERLGRLTSHDALLLRHSFAIPKVLFVLRTAPCFRSDQLGFFDDILRFVLSHTLNIDLTLHSTWLQATLAVRVGGIGIR